MRLAELSPTFLKWIDDKHFQMVDSLAGADGIEFLCPVCFAKNSGPIGTHAIICWTPRVPQTTSPVPGRWNMHGSGYADLSLKAGSSSVNLPESPCKAHFFVTDGAIILAMG